MSDLIDRSQEIGSKFLAWTPETGPCPISINDHYWFKKLCALFEKQAALEAQLAELTEQTRWIPVGERLPEDGQIVIGCFIWISTSVVVARYCKRELAFYEYWRGGQITVTNWMPLPNPPEVQND